MSQSNGGAPSREFRWVRRTPHHGGRKSQTVGVGGACISLTCVAHNNFRNVEVGSCVDWLKAYATQSLPEETIVDIPERKVITRYVPLGVVSSLVSHFQLLDSRCSTSSVLR